MAFGTFVLVFAGIIIALAIAMASAPANDLPGGLPGGGAWHRAMIQGPVVPPPPPGAGLQPGSLVPPLYMYHGTRMSNFDSIVQHGIEGRSGGWAFLAEDYQTAMSYGQAKGGETVIFRVRTQQAYQSGVGFSKRNGYFVAPAIHPGYIDFTWSLGDYSRRKGGLSMAVTF